MITLYWYPKCSTCKDAKKWLEEAGFEVETIDLVKEPPSIALLTQWMTQSELPIRRFFNTSGMKYRELGLKDLVNDYTIEEASQQLNSDGMLLKRPILVKDHQFLANGFKADAYERIMLK